MWGPFFFLLVDRPVLRGGAQGQVQAYVILVAGVCVGGITGHVRVQREVRLNVATSRPAATVGACLGRVQPALGR